ncbi:unnamed protein product [Fraxinus pennsylvanica]|uniref:Uncharacterized protein n=1 Tax=Fraxinus pennsylvanica TaxID=56036 RepID=A0AAD2EB28_9LAMI|nr:unnamed protein product [Fraxinus pennsylvanica]
MGFEGPASLVAIHVIGFKKFHGVVENPTETIVNNLQDYMKEGRFPKGLILGSCTIPETTGQGALVPLYQTLQSSVIKDGTVMNSGRVIWVALGSSFAYLRESSDTHPS